MNAMKVIELTAQYATCPNCGSLSIGNGEGAIIVDDEYFTRKCKCGFKVKVNEYGEETK